MRSRKVQAFVVGVLLLALAGLAYVTSDPRGAYQWSREHTARSGRAVPKGFSLHFPGPW